MIYKVIITKTFCVEAENEEQAENMIFDENKTFDGEERIEKIYPIPQIPKLVRKKGEE